MTIQEMASMGGKAGRGKPKSPEHKAKLREALAKARSQRTKPIPKPESPPPPLVRRCQAAHCQQAGQPVQVQGMTAWLCQAHLG